MKILNLSQGSAEWHSARLGCFTASEAAAAAGEHKYMTRDDLLKQKAFGVVPDVDAHQQRIFDQGHKFEEMARPIAEEIIGEELFPCTCVDDSGTYLASMDGLNMLSEIGWEHKSLNEKLRKATAETLEEHYKIQMDHQMMVTGAGRVLFMASNGTKEDCNWFWYDRDEDRIKRLVAAWDQFAQDLAAYTPKERKVEVVAAAQATLPSPWAEVKGEIAITDNLKQFGQALTAYVDGINLKPQTDQEFADLDAAVKTLKGAEEKLTQCEEIALSKLDSVAVLRTLINDYRETARQARLTGEKAVKAEKENRKNAIIQAAQEAFRVELAAANEEFAPVAVTGISADFYGAVKGLKSISSMESKCNDELARAKIELTAKRDQIRGALKIINDAGADYKFLFNDLQQLVSTGHDHLKLLVDKRVLDHKAAEQKRIDEAAAKKAEEIAAAQRKADQEKIDAEEARVQESISQARDSGVIKPDLLDELSGVATDLAASTRPAPTPIASRTIQSGNKVAITESQVITAVARAFDISADEAAAALSAMDFSKKSAKAANL